MDFREATNLLSVSLEQIAAITDRSYPTILAYRTGDRVPPTDVIKRLAAFMRAQSDALTRAAEELDGEKRTTSPFDRE
jgi:hypothetical protein